MTQLPDHYDDIGPGWRKVIDSLHIKLLQVDPQYSVKSVGCNWGVLSVYLHKEESIHWQLIADAEVRSGKVCDQCGSPGYLTSLFHYPHEPATRCQSHDPQRGGDE